jgi:hypothetical protein
LSSLSNKIIILIITAFIFSAVVSLFNYIPIDQREDNSYYDSFYSLFFIGVLYMTPIFVLFGLPISIIIDKILNQMKNNNRLYKYFFNLLFFLVAGLITGIIISLIFSSITNLEFLFMAIKLSSLASLLYLHTSLFIEPIIKQLKRKILLKLNQ